MQHKLRGAIGSGTAIVINLLIFTVPLLALVFDWSTFRLAMLISLLGVLAKVAGITETSRERPKVITTLAWLAIVMSTLSAYHRDSWGVFHLPIAILLLLPIFWAARTRGVQIKWAFWGACGGALLGAIGAGNRSLLGAANPLSPDNMKLALRSGGKLSKVLSDNALDVNKVLEVVEQLRTSGVRLHSSFIVGLPHEPAEEIYQANEFLIGNPPPIFKLSNEGHSFFKAMYTFIHFTNSFQ